MCGHRPESEMFGILGYERQRSNDPNQISTSGGISYPRYSPGSFLVIDPRALEFHPVILLISMDRDGLEDVICPSFELGGA
jgi:hypothetical protein